MFDRRKKGPTRPFVHADNCKIMKADPTTEIPWSEIERGHWRAVCQCGSEDRYDQAADRRTRLDPLDPSTSRHAGQCEYRDTTDPAVVRLILKVKDGMGGTTSGWSAAPAIRPGRFRTTLRRTWGDDEPAAASGWPRSPS